MQINDLYYQKYLKYKDKYLNLESQIGGGRFTGNKLTHNSQKQKILIQKHKQERNNLAQKHKNELKIQAQEEKQTKDFIIRENKVELLWEIMMVVIKMAAQELMKKQKQEVLDLARKHAREINASKS